MLATGASTITGAGYGAATADHTEASHGLRRQPDQSAERRVLAALGSGDESAFVALVGRHQSALLRLARLYAADHLVDGLIHDVWTALVGSIAAIDPAVSLRVTLVRFLLDAARRRVPDTAASIPFAAGWDPMADAPSPSVDPSKFRAAEPWIGHWASPVAAWDELPGTQPISRELRARIEAAIAMLSPAQHEVIALRDVEGWSSSDVSTAVGIAETTQRMFLHRARSRIRALLDSTLTTA
jgi:RNA polymerase sigma-70 factor (ECF subfamily)